MASYITSADITSTVLRDFNVTVYLNRTNDHLDYIAESMGLTSADISNPIHSVLKEYGVNWCNRAITLDKLGANNLDIGTNDKYLMLYNIFNDEIERLRKYLTPELIQDTATDPSEFSPTVTIYRG